MTSTAHELGVSVGQWNALVRRTRMTDKQKLASLIVSSYADSDGTGIHCGVARLATDMHSSYSTARRYLAWLRTVGLIELVREGNHRRKRSDEYRLILGPDVMEHLEVLDPDSYKALGDGLREANRDGSRKRTQRAAEANLRSPRTSAEAEDLRSPSMGADEPENGPDLRSPIASAEDAICAHLEPDLRSSLCERPPPLSTYPERSTSPTTDERDVRTDVAVVGAPAPEEPQISSDSKPTRCGHGFAIRRRPDGRPTCALCRVAEDRPHTALPPPLAPGHLATVIPIRSEAS